MELYDMLHPMLELSISIPAIILCFLPMKNHLNGKGRLLLLWGIPTLILWCVGAGWLCWRLRYSTKLCMLLTQALLLLFYCKAVPLSRWKTVNVFLAVCGVFSSMYAVMSWIRLTCSPDSPLLNSIAVDRASIMPLLSSIIR